MGSNHENASWSKDQLAAVLLVTRSKPGPKLVFHYPPALSRSHDTRIDINPDTSNSDEELDPGADKLGLRSTPVFENHERPSREERSIESDNIQESSNRILGYSEENLVKLLSPGRWCDKKKFEVCLDGLTFLGYPVYARPDGKWSENGPVEQTLFGQNDRPKQLSDEFLPENTDESHTDDIEGITITETHLSSKRVESFEHMPESFDSRAAQSLATSMRSTSTTSAVPVEEMTMFHVCFAMRAGNGADAVQSDVLQYHVAKKLSRALLFCQRQTGFIGNESRRLLAMRTKVKQEHTDFSAFWSRALGSSELATALKKIYESLSQGRIAAFKLSGMEMSLQIPPSDYVDGSDETPLNHNSALLLLEDKDALLRELTQTEATPLASFIRGQTPTKSLAKHARNLGMPLDNIMYLARHLIKWRKARSIAPLHPRNFYVVGTDAPLNTIQDHVSRFSRRFAALPSLPRILAMLSRKAIKYGSIIPSRDHRGPYMDILTYLVQHRFVVQLKTYGWLQTPVDSSLKGASSVSNINRRPLSVARLLSPQLRPVDDDSVSVSSEKTAIPVLANAAVDTTLNNFSPESAPDLTETQFGTGGRLIADPINLTPEDLQTIAIMLDNVDEELQERLQDLIPYFDGKHAFEEIAASEGLKPSKLERWLDILQHENLLMVFRGF